MRFAYVEGGGYPPVKVMKSAASKTWTRGYFANLESGRLDNYTTADVAIVGIINASVASSTAADYNVEVIQALPGVVFEIPYYSTAANFNSTNKGSWYSMYPGALNKISTTGKTTAATQPLVLVDYDNTRKVAFCKVLAQAAASILGR